MNTNIVSPTLQFIPVTGKLNEKILEMVLNSLNLSKLGDLLMTLTDRFRIHTKFSIRLHLVFYIQILKIEKFAFSIFIFHKIQMY